MANLTIGDRMIDFKLPATDGRTYSSSDLQDKRALVVIFSCNHCPYVRAWEDRMVAIQRDYAGKGVQLVAINANDVRQQPGDSFEAMAERAREKGFNFPYLRDETQEVARAYGAERTPEVFVFDAARRLVYHGRIDDNYEDPEQVRSHYLRRAIDAALEGRRPEVPETPPQGCTIKWAPQHAA